MRLPLLFLALCALAGNTRDATCAEGTTRDGNPARPPSIEITSEHLGLVSDPNVRPADRGGANVHVALGLAVANLTRRPLWLVVIFDPGAGGPSCRSILFVQPKRAAEASCRRDTVLADVDYPATVTAFADSALADSVDQASARLRFDANAIKQHLEKLATTRAEVEAGKLPRTFEGFSRKTSFGSSKRGDLLVSASAVSFISDKGSVEIPVAELRDVSAEYDGKSMHSLIVRYFDDKHRKRLLTLFPSSPRFTFGNVMKLMLESPTPPPILLEARTAIERAIEEGRGQHEPAVSHSFWEKFLEDKSKPAPAPVVTLPTPRRAGWTGAPGLAFAFIHVPPDTIDSSVGWGMQFSLMRGRFLNPRQAVAVRLTVTPTLNDTELFFVPVTLNMSASLETQYWLSDHYYLSGGVGAARYMTYGDIPRSGLMLSTAVSELVASDQGRLVAVWLGLATCLYPEKTAIEFTLGASSQWTRP